MSKKTDKSTEKFSDKMVWDLSAMYSGPEDPKIEKDLTELKKKADLIEKEHKGKLRNYDARQLLAFFKENDKHSEKSYILSVYTSLLFYSDTANEKSSSLLQRTELALADIRNRFIFIDIELAKHPKLKELSISKEVAPFNIFFENILKFRKHLLNQDQEEILNKLSLTSSNGWDRLYEQNFSKVAVKFRGKVVNKETLLNFLHSPDRNLRKDAGKAFSELLKSNIDLNNYIYNMLLLDKYQTDKIRQYAYPEESRHLANGLSEKIINTMVDTAQRNYLDVSRFYNLKRKLLGLKHLAYYDRLAPVIAKRAKEEKFSFDQAVRMIEKSFNSFDPEFGEIFMDLVRSNRIDVESRKGKRGGAFCMFMPKHIKPYILLNYFGRARDVQTLAHEAGHAIHDVLSSRKNPISVAHAPLTLAEVASIFAEMIMFENLIAKAKNDQEKIVLLAERIDDIINTIFRQIVFYIFEQKAHKLLKETGSLTDKQLRDIWMESQRFMFGNSVQMDEDYEYWWSYISHFFNSPFYVYSYAFANLLVFAIYEHRNEPDFVDKYKRLLALGGTKSTEDAIKEFGFNLEDPNFWQSGFSVISGLIDQLEVLC
ncbi:MAG: M3 family oligoendopeptidase [Candidatus Doudnabacteria bacterium]